MITRRAPGPGSVIAINALAILLNIGAFVWSLYHIRYWWLTLILCAVQVGAVALIVWGLWMYLGTRRWLEAERKRMEDLHP
jgi:hypothetical protein